MMKETTCGAHICPVCGQYEFEEYGSFDICPICNWEDDSLQLEMPNYSGGATRLSLNEYRKKWQEGDIESLMQ